MVENSDMDDVSALNASQCLVGFAKCLLILKIPIREKKKSTDISVYNNAETACQGNEFC